MIPALILAGMAAGGIVGLLFLVGYYLPRLYVERAAHPQYTDPVLMLPTLLLGTAGYGIAFGLLAGLMAAGALAAVGDRLRPSVALVMLVPVSSFLACWLSYFVLQLDASSVNIWAYTAGVALVASILIFGLVWFSFGRGGRGPRQ